MQEEQFAHQADKEQMALLSTQLGETKSSMHGAGTSEAAAKLQAQLQEALQALQVCFVSCAFYNQAW